MNLEEFREDLLNQAHARASVDGVFTSDAFMSEAADLLIGAGEVDSLDLFSFQGTGRRRQSVAVNGFYHDEQDTSVSLAIVHFTGGPTVPTLTYSDAATALGALEQYLREALCGDFLIDREPAMPEYQLAQTLKMIHSRGGDQSVSRFRLYLLTDARLSSRAKSMASSEVDGTPIEFHIWDMGRFFQINESQQGREPLELTLSDWGVEGVSALKVADSAGDVTTYLAAIPGSLLSALYRRHGSRLLEGNVRSFLTIRGKINRGIRDTILKTPELFLAYNNGISATASEVDYSAGAIRRITDLQIVNGGQTTASLFYATQGVRDLDLGDVFVQMKLVVVAPAEAQEMVPLISRFANSQNAVREDDFFSNNPFHVQMEELSRRILVPVKAGVNYQTKWYYERTRGQYLNERNRKTAIEQKKFEAEYPRVQVITKTDAAKYEVTWNQQPHQVSAGAQKNFKAYASLVAQRYVDQPQAFNDSYYKRMVAKAVLFNSVRSAISKADWYEAGYLANLTAYAIAKFALEISKNPRAESFDISRIWDAQEVGRATLNEAVAIARVALDVLTSRDRLVVNVTEWAKRESAWKRLADVRYNLGEDFLLECIPVKLNVLGEPVITVRARFSPEVPERRHVQEIGEATWRSVQKYLATRSLLSSSEFRQLGEVFSVSRRSIGTESARGLLHLYVKALNSGWRDDVAGPEYKV